MDVLPTDEELLLQTFGGQDDDQLLHVRQSDLTIQ